MDTVDMIGLRIIHIVAGVFWVGGFLFLTFILIPRLRALGPAVQGPVMGSVMKLAVPAFLSAAGLLMASGVWMALKLRWGVLDSFFNDAWGWAILVGAVLTVLAVLMGLLVTRPAMLGAAAIGASLQGSPPTFEQGAQLGALQKRMSRASHTTSALLVAAVICMAVARWI
jgi:uncharacterized membrane protein